MTSIGTGTAAETLVKAKTCLEALAERQNSASGQPSLLQLPIEDRVLEGETAKQFWRRVKERFPDLVLSDEKLGQCRMMVALEMYRGYAKWRPWPRLKLKAGALIQGDTLA